MLEVNEKVTIRMYLTSLIVDWVSLDLLLLVFDPKEIEDARIAGWLEDLPFEEHDEIAFKVGEKILMLH